MVDYYNIMCAGGRYFVHVNTDYLCNPHHFQKWCKHSAFKRRVCRLEAVNCQDVQRQDLPQPSGAHVDQRALLLRVQGQFLLMFFLKIVSVCYLTHIA